jgi:phosphatidylglycerol lysyltransferase
MADRQQGRRPAPGSVPRRVAVTLRSAWHSSVRPARRAPLALSVLAAVWILALGTGALPAGPPAGLAPSVLFSARTSEQHPLSLLLSLVWAPDLPAYLGATAVRDASPSPSSSPTSRR